MDNKIFRIRRFIVIILMMLPLIGNTQPYGYIDGYILLEKGDTIYGKLKVLTEEQSCSKIKFKNSEQKKIKYKIQEVKSYQRGSEAFVKKMPHNKTHFNYLKVLQLGKVNLYRYNVEERVLYKSFGFFTTYYIENKEVFFYVASDGFKDTMADFFADDVALAKRIENKELKYENIEEIVSIYNSD